MGFEHDWMKKKDGTNEHRSFSRLQKMETRSMEAQYSFEKAEVRLILLIVSYSQ